MTTWGEMAVDRCVRPRSVGRRPSAMRPATPRTIAATVTRHRLTVGCSALVLFAAGCSNDRSDPPVPAPMADVVRLDVDTLPPGVERVTQPQAFFIGSEDELDVAGLRRGWELVSPLPYPTSKRHRVNVVARLPTGATLDVKPVASKSLAVAPTIVFPAGTWLARVESIELKRGGTSIVDIRGVRFTDNGERFFVMRPETTGAGAPLVGLSWARDDEVAEAAAHKRMAEEMLTKNFGFLHRPPAKSVGTRADHFKSIGRCSACHERARPDFLPPTFKGDRKGFFPRRGTDDAGYYATASLFRVEQPRANYGKILGDTGPHFTERCATGEACDDDAPKMVKLALAQAADAADAHALKVCASRRGAHALASESARALLQTSLPLCPQDRR